MSWLKSIDKDGAKLVSPSGANAVLKAVKKASTTTTAETERRQLARAITIAKFGQGPDRPVDAEFDTPGERQETADWLNYTIGPWVYEVSTYWGWTFCASEELSKIALKSEFAWLCYTHLQPKIPISQTLKTVGKTAAKSSGKKNGKNTGAANA